MTTPPSGPKGSGLSSPSGNDPRLSLTPDELEEASLSAMPEVARRSSSSGVDMTLVAGMLGALVLGGLTLVVLSNQRQTQPPPAPLTQTPVPPPPPEPMTTFEPQYMPPPQPMPPVMVEPMPTQPPPPVPVNAEGSRAPALVIDNSEPAPAAAAAAGAAKAGGNLLSGDEQFAARFNSEGATKASRLANPSMTVPQGAIIPAVLETALNSDLPGYVRALVSRDVKSFDGKRVLIPRGSRLIGQYKSGLATGVTRAFVIWNRVLRPDGVSVQLASPATDEMGQAGLTGKVDNHFAKRFGAAALLSVVSGLASNTGSSSTIVIGSTSQAQNVANDALSADMKIPPTIKVAQGTAIQVFVASDLDFSQ